MIIPDLLPFIDAETQRGFYINLANQLVTCLYGVKIISGTELFTCILKNTTCATAIIESSILDFDFMMQEINEFSMKKSYEFGNIILKILVFDRLISGLYFDLFYSS